MTLADLLGTPTDLEYTAADGAKIVYKLRRPTLDEQAQFQRWLESRQREAVGRATDIDERLQAKLLKEVNDSIAAGECEWEGELCARALNTPLGIAKLLSIILAGEGVTLPLAEDIVRQQLMKIVEILATKADDPKVLSAIQAALGSPSDNSSFNSSTRRSTKRSRKSRR